MRTAGRKISAGRPPPQDLRRKILVAERGLGKPHATLFQADELFPGAQDQVIQHLNRQVVSGFNDLPRNTDILRRGGCLARRMIMYYHDTGSVDSDGRPEDLRRPYHDAPHSRVGCQRVALAGTFPTAPLRTGRDTFASSGSPETYFLLSCCDIVPAWIASWQLWQTIRVFRRLAIMVCIQTGFSFRPFLFRSASLRMWCTSFCPVLPQSSHSSAKSRCNNSDLRSLRKW
jgi:hypothetical protein